jgi:hypothetical protein
MIKKEIKYMEEWLKMLGRVPDKSKTIKDHIKMELYEDNIRKLKKKLQNKK